VLVVPIKKTTDKFIGQAISKGRIVVPNSFSPVKCGKLFLIDDVSQLGISFPQQAIEILAENNQPLEILRAQDLAFNLSKLIREKNNPVLVGGGGVLTYFLLRNARYEKEPKQIIEVERDYSSGKPVCRLLRAEKLSSNLIIDDVLASGQTISTILSNQSRQSEIDLACLVASSNIPKGNEGYRIRQNSTMTGIRTLYSTQFVNGQRQKTGYDAKPAILSLRYLITKAVNNDDYAKNYLANKFGGLQKAEAIRDLLSRVDTEPLNLLRRNPKEFLDKWKVK